MAEATAADDAAAIDAWTAASPDADAAVVANLEAVRARIAAALEKAERPAPATLVAVSKTKPLGLVAAAARSGQRDFGENYVQELHEKATAAAAHAGEDPAAAALRWHFIGRIQSNKAKLLCSVPNLGCVHTVHSEKIAAALQRHWAPAEGGGGGAPPLDVCVQVNTSGEESKGGCEPSEAASLARYVANECPNLRLAGLMCIGKYSGAEGDASPDFVVLRTCREQAAMALGVAEDSLALSMGMSHDFETALAFGATHVRVGSTIFGARVYADKPAA